MMKKVFITGGTGYIGSRLVELLLERGHRVVAFVRPGSEGKVPAGAEVIGGDPFDAPALAKSIPPGAVFVQLLGVPHPSPRKRDLFYQIDLQSVKASVEAAVQAGVTHFVYVSVAMEPSGIMADYQKVRALGEHFILEKKLPHTFVRPWYVVGPGHWWPLLLWPVYQIMKLFPGTRRKALAFGLVSLREMLAALVLAVEAPEKFDGKVEVETIQTLKISDYNEL